MKTTMNVIHTSVALFALAWVLPPIALAVAPPPDGCYPGYTTAVGCDALSSLTTGAGNTGLGWDSLFFNTTGSYNTGVGGGALALNQGDSNTATGAGALLLNTSGTENTAIGANAMVYNDTGIQNTAIGSSALFSNTEGVENTAMGATALLGNTTGDINVAVGSRALTSNTTGSQNNALGWDALANNTVGGRNVAVGTGALEDLTGGDSNIAVGGATLAFSETVNYNTALGRRALYRIRFEGDQNTGVGFFAGSNLTDGGANNIYIGNVGPDPIGTESNTIRLGTETATVATEPPGGETYPMPAHTATFIAGISGTPVVGDTVVVDANGQLGTIASSARFKKDIKPMAETSEAILSLKPVSFMYKGDNKGTPQFGLIAEEVAKVNPHLVVRDRNGEIYSVRYEAVNAMLLNEFLKEHRKVEHQDKKLREQDATIADLKSGMQALIATVKEQASQIQRVSAQLEVQNRSGRTIANKP